MNHIDCWYPKPDFLVATLLALTTLITTTIPAHAAQFSLDAAKVSFSSQLSLGGSWRLEDPNKNYLSPTNYEGGKASTSVNDDGNLNFKKGEMFSLIFKGRHDLGVDFGSYGVFTRVRYWYDYELEEGDRHHGNGLNGYVEDEPLDDSEFHDFAKSSGAEIMDAYIYAGFDAGDVPIDVRLGRQVLSWGEGLFIQNGVNVVSPIDASALRKPGSELKDALLPVGLFYAAAGLTENLSFESFYQYEWEKFIVDGCGTFFSPSDVAPDGCPLFTTVSTDTDATQIAGEVGQTLQTITGELDITVPRAYLTRGKDLEPESGGQYGFAFRYYAEALHSTEFAVYYLNYHSRLPFLGMINSDSPESLGIVGGFDFGASVLGGTDAEGNRIPGNAKFFMEFPEDIQLYGLTFATNISGWSVAGELSYRPEMPLQMDTVELAQATLLSPDFAPWSMAAQLAFDSGYGGIVHGYDYFEFTQIQVSLLKNFDHILKAETILFGFEVGANFIGGLPDLEEGRYGRDPTYGVGDFGVVASPSPLGVSATGTCAVPALYTPNENPDNCTDGGFTTDSAWGYQFIAMMDYPSAFSGISLQPTLAWSHGVKGNSPPPNFVEEAKSLSLGLSANYLNRYSANIAYTAMFGGDYNTMADRDFASLSFGYSF